MCVCVCAHVCCVRQGPEQCPSLCASQGPSFPGWQGGRLGAAGQCLLSHAAQPLSAGVGPRSLEEGPAPLELFLLGVGRASILFGEMRKPEETEVCFFFF